MVPVHAGAAGCDDVGMLVVHRERGEAVAGGVRRHQLLHALHDRREGRQRTERAPPDRLAKPRRLVEARGAALRVGLGLPLDVPGVIGAHGRAVLVAK